MIRTGIFFTTLFFFVSNIPAQTVALSGTVTRRGSTDGIADVKVSTVKQPSLSAMTSADGSFILTGASTRESQPQRTRNPQFTLDGNVVTFASTIRNAAGAIELFSGDGRRGASLPISKFMAGTSVALPVSAPGITVVRVTLNGESSTFRGVCLGNDLFLNRDNSSGYCLAAKKSAAVAVDTLVAEKSGYLPGKIAIDRYTQTGIAVQLDTGAGNPDGHYPVPADAGPEAITNPDHIIGTGTPESCTPRAFIDAVAKGGTIVFNGGKAPFTIILDKPAKVFNNADPDIVIDGGGIVTLSGGGTTRILYMNTCDEKQVWTTSHCDNQDHPRLTVQNLTFIDGNAINADEEPGGGAIFAQGGRLKIVNCCFFNNVCAETGPDVGGGAVRAFMQYNGKPLHVVNSTFGGAPELGNVGSNGGALSSIGVSWTIINSLFSYNRAIGNGGNPKQSGTPGGGSGGAIYNDGNTMTLSVFGTLIEHNSVNAYGSAIFFVTNDHSGDIVIDTSLIRNNTGGSWYTLPGISMHDDTKRTITRSTIK